MAAIESLEEQITQTTNPPAKQETPPLAIVEREDIENQDRNLEVKWIGEHLGFWEEFTLRKTIAKDYPNISSIRSVSLQETQIPELQNCYILQIQQKNQKPGYMGMIRNGRRCRLFSSPFAKWAFEQAEKVGNIDIDDMIAFAYKGVEALTGLNKETVDRINERFWNNLQESTVVGKYFIKSVDFEWDGNVFRSTNLKGKILAHMYVDTIINGRNYLVAWGNEGRRVYELTEIQRRFGAPKVIVNQISSPIIDAQIAALFKTGAETVSSENLPVAYIEQDENEFSFISDIHIDQTVLPVDSIRVCRSKMGKHNEIAVVKDGATMSSGDLFNQNHLLAELCQSIGLALSSNQFTIKHGILRKTAREEKGLTSGNVVSQKDFQKLYLAALAKEYEDWFGNIAEKIARKLKDIVGPGKPVAYPSTLFTSLAAQHSLEGVALPVGTQSRVFENITNPPTNREVEEIEILLPVEDSQLFAFDGNTTASIEVGSNGVTINAEKKVVTRRGIKIGGRRFGRKTEVQEIELTKEQEAYVFALVLNNGSITAEEAKKSILGPLNKRKIKDWNNCLAITEFNQQGQPTELMISSPGKNRKNETITLRRVGSGWGYTDSNRETAGSKNIKNVAEQVAKNPFSRIEVSHEQMIKLKESMGVAIRRPQKQMF